MILSPRSNVAYIYFFHTQYKQNSSIKQTQAFEKQDTATCFVSRFFTETLENIHFYPQSYAFIWF